MDFTKWEKLIDNIPLDFWVPHDVVEEFLNEVYKYDNYYYDCCFQDCGLIDNEEDLTWEYEQRDQDEKYKKAFSKISKEDFENSPYLYLTTDGFIIPFTYQCFKQLINELKEME